MTSTRLHVVLIAFGPYLNQATGGQETAFLPVYSRYPLPTDLDLPDSHTPTHEDLVTYFTSQVHETLSPDHTLAGWIDDPKHEHPLFTSATAGPQPYNPNQEDDKHAS